MAARSVLLLYLFSCIFGLVESGMLCGYRKRNVYITLSLASVNLVPDGAIPLCPGEFVKFVCNTTAGELLWETSSAPGANQKFFLASQLPVTLGAFILSVEHVSMMSGVVTGVSSTATTVTSVRLSDDGVTLVCFESTDLTMSEQAVLRVRGKFRFLLSH